jgi:hypothetical protein
MYRKTIVHTGFGTICGLEGSWHVSLVDRRGMSEQHELTFTVLYHMTTFQSTTDCV